MHRGTFKRTHTKDCTYFTNCWRPTSASQQCLLLETVCTTQKYLFFFTVFCTKHRQYREGQALQLAAKQHERCKSQCIHSVSSEWFLAKNVDFGAFHVQSWWSTHQKQPFPKHVFFSRVPQRSQFRVRRTVAFGCIRPARRIDCHKAYHWKPKCIHAKHILFAPF